MQESKKAELVERYKQHTFYSKASQRLFLVPDYYTNGSGIVNNLIENLVSVQDFFQNQFGIKEIYCSEITRSRWCLNKWLFQQKLENPTQLPDFVKIIEMDMWDFVSK